MKNHCTFSSFSCLTMFFFYQGKFSVDEAVFEIDVAEKVCWYLGNKRKTFGFKIRVKGSQ